MASSVGKDIEAKLLSTRRCRRQPGQVVYPLEYTTDAMDFDIWDHMFLLNCCKSITMHQFDRPPSLVLDLGCGSGFWAVEAAKQWQSSIIVGYDIRDIQPNLHALSGLGDLARRVKWVHGNLLDGLPFPPDHFDFIRIASIGLGVPEDEWQYVLEEVSRIMKPGAVVEIIEEDLIFPCDRPPRVRPPALSVFVPPQDDPSTPSVYSGQSSASFMSDPYPFTPTDAPETPNTLLRGKSQPSLFDSMTSLSPVSTLAQQLPIVAEPSTPADVYDASRLTLVEEDAPSTPHPQDHTRLKNVWESMLSRRFLALQLVTVLPFYLSSTFVDIKCHAPFNVPIPSNSFAIPTQEDRRHPIPGDVDADRFDPDAVFEMKSASKRRSDDSEDPQGASKTSQRTVPAFAPMHLAKTVNTVKACKNAMWEEYHSIYGSEEGVTAARTHRFKSEEHPSITFEKFRLTVRDEFETAWRNWELDMNDRIGMRHRVVSECAWSDCVGEYPDWRVWKSAVTHMKVIPPSDDSAELCRTLRGFVGRKPMVPLS